MDCRDYLTVRRSMTQHRPSLGSLFGLVTGLRRQYESFFIRRLGCRGFRVFF